MQVLTAAGIDMPEAFANQRHYISSVRAGTRRGAHVLRTEKQSGPKHQGDSRAYKTHLANTSGMHAWQMHLVNTSSARIQYLRAVPADGEREPVGRGNLDQET